MSGQKTIDKLLSAIDADRLRSSFVELLEEEPFTRFEEWADALREVAEAVDSARDAIIDWQDAEGREEKTDARDRALEELQTLIDAWINCPLDLDKIEDFEEVDD